MAKGAFTQLEQLIQLRHQAEELNLSAKNKAKSALAGSVNTHFRGRGIDFEEVRSYQAGDDIRTIDWRVTARTGQAHTKLFREDRERPVLLLVDQSHSMAFGSQQCFKSVQAAEVASLLTWAALGNNDCIGGLVFNQLTHCEIKPKRTRRTALQLLNTIHAYNNQAKPFQQAAQTEQTINTALEELRRITKPGSSVFIISDFKALNEHGKQQLHQLKRHNDVNAIYIVDPMEKQLPAQGEIHFSDGVLRKTLNIYQKKVQQAFSQGYQAQHRTLLAQTRSIGIPMIEIATTDNAYAKLAIYFHKRPSKSRKPSLLDRA